MVYSDGSDSARSQGRLHPLCFHRIILHSAVEKRAKLNEWKKHIDGVWREENLEYTYDIVSWIKTSKNIANDRTFDRIRQPVRAQFELFRVDEFRYGSISLL
jgi:hypothetical protein